MKHFCALLAVRTEMEAARNSEASGSRHENASASPSRLRDDSTHEGFKTGDNYVLVLFSIHISIWREKHPLFVCVSLHKVSYQWHNYGKLHDVQYERFNCQKIANLQ